MSISSPVSRPHRPLSLVTFWTSVLSKPAGFTSSVDDILYSDDVIRGTKPSLVLGLELRSDNFPVLAEMGKIKMKGAFITEKK